MERCDGCGFVYDLALVDVAAAEIVARADQMASILSGGEDRAVRRRPQPDTWSVLEYCCHVRDVLLVHQARKDFVRVDELAALAVFLASEHAASMTASAIAMDGGWTQH